ncbi:MAG: hypothetical protein R2809_03770 [Flavobacteriales bacterium]
MKPLPLKFVERIENDRPNDCSVFLEGLERPVYSSVQVNPNKTESDDWKSVVSAEVPWWSGGKMLSSRPKFTQDPLFHAGAYYSQESSSMMVGWIAEQLLQGKKDLRVLDLCAAPGGKSILLSEVVGDRGLVFSNEINKGRNQILVENLVKWGATNVLVSLGDASKYKNFEGYFDLILVDAPCSGEGMFRKDEVAREEWSPENVLMCAARQKDILSDVLPLVREGGHIIYSTCTFAKSENEEVCEWILEQENFEGVIFDLPESWNLEYTASTEYRGYKFLPHKVLGEGFFCAAFTKTSGKNFKLNKRGTKPFFKPVSKASSDKWGLKLEANFYSNPHDEIFASPLANEEFQWVISELFVTLPGIEVGKIIRDELIPAHHLAMIPNVHSVDSYLELSKEQALDYLCKEDIKIESPTVGWAIVSYRQTPLGWVKLMKQRVNNYYPKEWKIRFREF